MLGQPSGDHGLRGEVADRHRRAVVLGQRRRDQLPLDCDGQRQLADGGNRKLDFGRIKHDLRQAFQTDSEFLSG